jgi:demethylmenaquinone methyltransferase/2-methoxy-6-polyprenyl-1,4-benzoquinol methylase
MSHDKHQAFFDQLASEWDLNFTVEDLERLQHHVPKLGAQPGMDVLDLGCGTGILFDLLRRAVGDEGSVTGVDFSLQMARQAHRNFPFDNVNVVDADVSQLPFPADTFDLAVAFAAFPHFEDKRETLRAMHRVLKPGAHFFILHLESSKELSEMHRKVGGVVAEDFIPDAQELTAMFEETGFNNVRIQDHKGFYLASAVNAK